MANPDTLDRVDRAEAQRRVEQIESFRRELTELDRSGVLALSSDQAAAVRGYHDTQLGQLAAVFDVDRTAAELQLSLGMRIASALGGLALCLAVALFVERYWGLLALWQQCVLLIAAPLTALVLAEYSSTRERTLYITSLFSLVALAAFAVNLALLNDLFALNWRVFPAIAWTAFALLVAMRYRFRVHLALGLAAGIIAFSLLALRMAGRPFEHRPELHLAAGCVVAALSFRQDPFFAPVYRGVGVLAVLFSLLALSKVGGSSFLPFSERAVEGWYTLLTFGVSAVIITVGVRRRWLETMLVASISFALFLLMKMYDWLWEAVPAFVFFALLGVLSLALIFAFRRLRDNMQQLVRRA